MYRSKSHEEAIMARKTMRAPLARSDESIKLLTELSGSDASTSTRSSSCQSTAPLRQWR